MLSKQFDNSNRNMPFSSMVFARSEQAKRERALKKRREAVASKIAFLLAMPCLAIYFMNYKYTTMTWLSEQGLLPKYGIMQFLEGRQMLDWDQVMVSGIAGGLFMTIGYIVAWPFAKILVR